MAPQDREVPPLNLSHGQALWVLENMGFRTGDTPTAFNAYLMGLRRAGLPFAEGELGQGPGHNVTYRFEHLMELTVALALRAQAILPRDVVNVLAQSRPRLRQIYRRAWTDRKSGLGAPEWIVPGKQPRFQLQGIYLDLRLMHVETGFFLHASPIALGPGQYIGRASTKNILQHMRDPLPISDMAEKIVELAAGAPEVRRGRPK
jgi:hypothetical protein